MRDRNFERMTNEVIDKTFNAKVVLPDIEKMVEEKMSEYWKGQLKYERELIKHYKGNPG